MKLLLVLLVTVFIATFFAGSSDAHARNGTTRAEITIVVPLGFPDPTTSGGVGNVRADFNRSMRKLANESERRRGMVGVTLDAVSDVRLGTVSAHLTTTLWQANAVQDRSLRSSTPGATTNVYLEDEFTITAGTSGLPNGSLVNVDFLSTIIGQIDIDDGGGLEGTSRETYVSQLFAGPVGGQPLVEHRWGITLGRLDDPRHVPVNDGVNRVVQVRIGDTLRIDTHLRVGFGTNGVAADYWRPVTNELTIEGRTLLLPSASHPDIVITSLGGAPGALGDEGPGDVFDPAPERVNRNQDPAPDPEQAADPAAPSNPDSAVGSLPGFPDGKSKKAARQGKAKGRSVIGQIGQSYFRPPGNAAPPLSQIIVLTKQGEVTLLIDADTLISAPPDSNVGLEVLTFDPPTRVAVLTDRSPLAEDGTLSEELATARKIVVIPQFASRQHRRVVVAEETKGDRIKFVDEAAGVADLAAKTDSKFIKGETVIILVQKGNSGVKRSRVRAVFKADRVAKRLERWANKEAGRSGNAFKRGRIDALLEKHLDAQAKKLDRISAKAPKGMKAFVGQTVRRMVQDRNAAKKRLRTRGVGQANLECVRNLLGRVPATQKQLTPDQRRRVNAECTVAKVSVAPGVEINSPKKGETIFAGSNLRIGVEGIVGDSPIVSLEIIVNGVSQEVVNNPVGLVISEFQVPVDITLLEVRVKATDGEGKFVWESVDLPVAEDPPPIVGGARLGSGWNLTGNGWNLTGNGWNLTEGGWNLLEGERYSISVQAEDNGKVESVDISIGGRSYPATLKDGKWVAEFSTPKGAVVSREISSNIIPNVFAGTALIGGMPAPDGTVVTAWISSGSGSSTSTIEIVAVDNLSKTAIGTQEIKLGGHLSQVGQGTVSGGIYSLLVHQREGGSFAGQTITFKIGELNVEQTGIWETGAGSELNLRLK